VAALAELAAEIGVVVDFPVEDDHRVAVVAADGLLAAGQVDDAQAHGAHRDVFGLVDSLLIGPPVREQARDPVNSLGIGGGAAVGEAYSTVPSQKWRRRG